MKIIIEGPTGSGKTTLLHELGLFLRRDRSVIVIASDEKRVVDQFVSQPGVSWSTMEVEIVTRLTADKDKYASLRTRLRELGCNNIDSTSDEELEAMAADFFRSLSKFALALQSVIVVSAAALYTTGAMDSHEDDSNL